MMAFSNPITGGQGALIRPAIKSPNYVPGVSGWTVNRDGSAEFNNGVFRGTVTAAAFIGTDFVINSSGQFFYNGAPALNTLSVSIAPSPGTDAFGNQYLAGVTVYDESPGSGPVGYVQMIGQTVIMGNVNANGTWQQLAQGAGQLAGSGANVDLLTATIPGNAAFADSVQMSMISGTAAQPTGSATAPNVSWTDQLGTSALDMWLSGTWIKASNGGVPLTWQTVANGGVVLGTGWADNGVAGTSQKIQYRKDVLDNLVIIGTVHSTSATPAATIFTIPAAYRPKVQQFGVVNTRVSPTNTVDCAAVSTAGVIALQTAVAAANTDVTFMITVPLGNIA